MLEPVQHWFVVLLIASIAFIGSAFDLSIAEYASKFFLLEYALINFLHLRQQRLTTVSLFPFWRLSLLRLLRQPAHSIQRRAHRSDRIVGAVAIALNRFL